MNATTLPAATWITCCLAMSAAANPERRPPGIPLHRHRSEEPMPEPRQQPQTDIKEEGTLFPEEFRTIDGSNNHFDHPDWGMPDHPFRRRLAPDYADGVGTPAGPDRPSPRAISNAVVAQEESRPNRRGATDFLWQWGQFLDHDIDETPVLDPPEAFDIMVPAGDPWFDPFGTGAVTIPLDRSYYELVDGVRQQVNGITAYIDGSNVYGSDTVRAYALRKLDGSGQLKTTESDHGSLLPYNEGGHANAPDSSAHWFIAGDVRANEQAGLMAMHTLFVREHNQWADSYRDANPSATEDEIYEFARMIVGAEIQHITYAEFLPLLLGPEALPPYRGFRPEVDPSILNEFATAAYRFGHSLLPLTIRRVEADGSTSEAGDLPLADAFFNPSLIETEGIETILRGLASQRCEELDGQLVDGVRNFLFGPPGSGGFDLASLNIQRGRDHGLASYNQARRQLGMKPARSFRDIHPNREVSEKLAAVYGSVDDIDLWVGGLCEAHARDAMVGPLFRHIITEQFIRLRDGDRFFYQTALAPEMLRLVEQQSLSRIIKRNTEIGEELADNVFLLNGGDRQESQHQPQRGDRRSQRRSSDRR